MSNEKRQEHNTKARQAAHDSHIANVNFYRTTAKMVGAEYLLVKGQGHVELRIGKATFIMEAKDDQTKILEMLQIGYAVVAAADELMKNGAS